MIVLRRKTLIEEEGYAQITMDFREPRSPAGSIDSDTPIVRLDANILHPRALRMLGFTTKEGLEFEGMTEALTTMFKDPTDISLEAPRAEQYEAPRQSTVSEGKKWGDDEEEEVADNVESSSGLQKGKAPMESQIADDMTESTEDNEDEEGRSRRNGKGILVDANAVDAEIGVAITTNVDVPAGLPINTVVASPVSGPATVVIASARHIATGVAASKAYGPAIANDAGFKSTGADVVTNDGCATEAVVASETTACVESVGCCCLYPLLVLKIFGCGVLGVAMDDIDCAT
ncbi:hypothetical protein K7X08_034148 [Anisodus acutangulus]|uniref:Uncharacterized protein n=1 Tax=Anisodus acutangulus TaxID=402998 RepID=A0A9Q1LEW2_9SOLA|nr:hypothetical protein K7X08_034148 [Anisodus acutangulus]